MANRTIKNPAQRVTQFIQIRTSPGFKADLESAFATGIVDENGAVFPSLSEMGRRLMQKELGAQTRRQHLSHAPNPAPKSARALLSAGNAVVQLRVSPEFKQKINLAYSTGIVDENGEVYSSVSEMVRRLIQKELDAQAKRQRA